MIDIEIESTGRRLTLSRGERIRVTYQAADFGEAGSGKGSFSTSFTVPMTAENIETLGFSPVINVRASLSPYKYIKARLLDGSNEIDKGFVRIDEDDPVSRKIKITFLGRNIDWFSDLGDKKVNELDFSRYDHTSSPENINTSRNEGYVYLPVDYGSLDNRSTATINITEIYPAFFIKDIVKQIFKEVGYKVKGSLLKRPDYNRMIIPYNGLEPFHSDQWVEDRTVYVSGLENKGVTGFAESLINLDAVAPQIQFGGPQYGYFEAGGKLIALKNSRLNNLNIPANAYVADEPMFVSVTAIVDSGRDFNDQVAAFIIKKNGDTHIQVLMNRYLAKKFDAIELNTGDYLQLFIQSFSGGTAIDYNPLPIGIAKTSYYIFTPEKKMAANSTFQASQFLPAITQKSLIEYLFFKFLIIPEFDKATNSVVLNTVNDLTISEAENWSGKVDTKQEIERDYFDFVSEYSRDNICKYSEDQDDFLLEQYRNAYNKEYGEGSIQIDNDYLEGSQEYYTAPFAPSISRNVFQGVPNLNMFLPYIVQAETPTPRILFYVPRANISELTNGIISSISVVGVNVTEIPYAFFINPSLRPFDPIISQHLGFGNPQDFIGAGKSILESNYSNLIRVLNRPIVVKPNLRLTALEVATIKYNRLKYIEELGGYYYLNKVGQYDGSGEPTECELIKWY